jgi:hypothetical protein
MGAPAEFGEAAYHFVRKHLKFLDRNWLSDVLDPALAELLSTTVTKHTSSTSNTALREATKAIAGLAEHALTHLPHDARKCRCRDLDNGEHMPQPICHVCAISNIKVRAERALDTP